MQQCDERDGGGRDHSHGLSSPLALWRCRRTRPGQYGAIDVAMPPLAIAAGSSPLYLLGMRHRALFRACAVLWAVLQFALPTGAAFADAQLERETVAGLQAHVESGSDESCRPPHADDCGLCQVVSRTGLGTACQPLLDAIGASRRSAPRASSSQGADSFARASLPRAPPVALS